MTTLIAALEALAERNVRIVNLSLSDPPNEVLKRAIASAQEKGMLIVAAAGNNGPGAAPSYPAAYPGVIAVTAVDHNLAIYSRATQGEYIDLAAPGVNLWVAAPGGGGTARSGTSYAVPFISAAAAILRASDALPDAASVQTTLEEQDPGPRQAGTRQNLRVRPPAGSEPVRPPGRDAGSAIGNETGHRGS